MFFAWIFNWCKRKLHGANVVQWATQCGETMMTWMNTFGNFFSSFLKCSNSFFILAFVLLVRYNPCVFYKINPLLSLVCKLFLDRNHSKKFTLGGILRDQTAGTWTGIVPLKLMTSYRDTEEYTPLELNCQIRDPPPFIYCSNLSEKGRHCAVVEFLHSSPGRPVFQLVCLQNKQE